MDDEGNVRRFGFRAGYESGVFFILDTLIGFTAFYLAFFLRFEWSIPAEEWETFVRLLPVIFICRSVSYLIFGFYSRLWEYASLEDLILIIKGVAVGSFLFVSYLFLYSNPHISIPRSVPIIDAALLVIMLGGARLAWRMWNERVKRKSFTEEMGIKVLIYGAGGTGAGLLKNLRTQYPNYRVCGFIDDDPRMVHSTLMGVKVLGGRKSLPRLVNQIGVKEILIAINNLSSENLNEIVKLCNKSVVNYKIVASVVDLVTKEVHVSKIRKIEVSDLLGRESVSLNLKGIKKMIAGKRVLVTGAGGSIGSELCQQILEYEPSSLVMLDRGENYLYDLKTMLRGPSDKTNMHFIFGSITNRKKMESIFSTYKPQLVFHAAAHKHVPLMEENADEAIINNVYGTKTTADVSDKYGVEYFVMISTDKVIRPTSIMGMTKKIAEKYVKYLNGKSQTKFMTVRFGNVLGSKGSVIPLFQSQIESGGPLTVTDPNMTRYFMLIPEAVQLILQAADIGKGGEIFILEMGEPVKIDDLARKMIRLAGYEPDRDIKIKYVGIRPGEKMYEELIDPQDEAIQTFHEKIKILNNTNTVGQEFVDNMTELFQMAIVGDRENMQKIMQSMIPDANSIKFTLKPNMESEVKSL